MIVPPPKHIAVVLFYNSRGEILLQDRRKKSKWGEDYGFFGGSVEPEESPEQALRREIDEELGITDFDFSLFKTYTHQNLTMGGEVERNIYVAPLPDISDIVCKDGKMEVRTFSNSLALKMIPGFNELLQEIYHTLRAQGKTI